MRDVETWWKTNGWRAQIGFVLLGVILVLPALRAGFFGDDYLQIAQLESWSWSPARPLDLYSFFPRNAAVVERMRGEGVIPYFAAPGLKIAFLRPLSSALMWFDHALFGRSPVGYHVHSLAWYAGMLLTAALLLRRAAPAGSLAPLALLIFCLDDGHAMAVAFTAARNASVACTLAWLAVIAHLRWRTERWRPGGVLALVLAALALAGGEMALGALAYLVAWELSQRRQGRARALTPLLLLVAAYLIVYGATAWGAQGSDAYLDPFGDAPGFLRRLPERTLLLLGNLIVSAPIDVALFDQRLLVPLLAIGGAAGLAVAIWLPRAMRRMEADEANLVRWMGLAAIAALLASAPALPGERVLTAASLGGAVVVAALLRDAWRLFRAGRQRPRAVLALVALGLPNLVGGAVALPGKTVLYRSMFNESRRLAGAAEIASPVPARVVVVALDDLVAVYLPAIRVFEQGWTPAQIRAIGAHKNDADPPLPLPDRIGYRGTTVLSLASADHRLRRTSADEFELSTPGGTLLDGTWAGLLRARTLPLARGSVVRTSFMTATVVDDRAGIPTRVAFRFDRSLDDPALVFLIPARAELRRLIMPAIGVEIAIPRRPPFEAPPPPAGRRR
ncbi:MAG TPA: hypothetical protein VFH68_02705 [Polyangia bacterium]|nr:hypothetical protein [Polyangia bacterium]